jgi:hypothetical protein
MSAPAYITTRCNPFGHGTDRGPRHLLGGMYGPEYEGGHKWLCDRPSAGRYRMTCRCGHRGQPMELCGPGMVLGPAGNPYPHPGHNSPEFMDRVSGACPACLFPPEARMWTEVAERDQAELGTLQLIGYEMSPQATMLRRKVEEARTRLDELNASGLIHKCPLTLTEMS